MHIHTHTHTHTHTHMDMYTVYIDYNMITLLMVSGGRPRPGGAGQEEEPPAQLITHIHTKLINDFKTFFNE